jgi:hypothetical protein
LNQPAPDFTLEAHNGQQVRLADYLGKQAVRTLVGEGEESNSEPEK